MKILVDTNILFSAILFPRSKPALALLHAAIVSDVDIILTGDKDFLCLDIEHPRCITAAQFLELEGVK